MGGQYGNLVCHETIDICYFMNAICDYNFRIKLRFKKTRLTSDVLTTKMQLHKAREQI
jgi:hypothetical protein